jgi:hypothetical protein
MPRELPENLKYFLKNALKDSDDGYEYASELCRILNSDDCQLCLTSKEIESLRDFADEVKRDVGEINRYTEEKIQEIETRHFGKRGILGYLEGQQGGPDNKPVWPF